MSVSSPSSATSSVTAAGLNESGSEKSTWFKIGVLYYLSLRDKMEVKTDRGMSIYYLGSEVPWKQIVHVPCNINIITIQSKDIRLNESSVEHDPEHCFLMLQVIVNVNAFKYHISLNTAGSTHPYWDFCLHGNHI
jgi:hypothetical protein